MKKMSGLLGSYGEFATSGQDQRINKKTKPVNQAGGPNYLGKAEMVTVPKQWLSSPDHVVAELAYITPAEQKILIDANLYGSLDGKPNRGPGGLMSLQGDMGSIGGDDGNDGSDGGSGGTPGLGGSQDVGSGFAGPASSPSDTGGGMSPGRSQAQFGTTEFAGMTESEALGQIGAGEASQQAMDVQANLQAQKAAEIAALENLNRQMLELSRRERKAEQLPGIFGKIALANVRSLAGNLIGKDLGVLGSFGVGQKGLENFAGLPVGMLASRQERAVTNDMGQVIGFRDEYGNLVAGRDPDAMGPDGDGPDTIPAEYNPVTGQQNQCPDGYTFDEDLQACRMSADLPSFGTPITTPGPYAAGDYARMGLLDIAPMGMSLFADRYGIPQMDFDTANLAFRRAGATRPQYFRKAPDLTGYTLLS